VAQRNINKHGQHFLFEKAWIELVGEEERGAKPPPYHPFLEVLGENRLGNIWHVNSPARPTPRYAMNPENMGSATGRAVRFDLASHSFRHDQKALSPGIR
jgi:hypothetical protein